MLAMPSHRSVEDVRITLHCQRSEQRRLSVPLAAAVAIWLIFATALCNADGGPAVASKPTARLLAEARLVPDCDEPIVRVRFLGKDRYFAFDTGCTTNVVDASLQAQLGEQLRMATVGTAAGEIRRPFFKDPGLTLGGFPLKSEMVGCSDLNFASEPLGYPLEGIVGMAPLQKHVVELDPAGGTVRIYDCLPDHAKRNAEEFSLRKDSICPVISGKLPDGASEDFLVDSGNAFASLALRDHIFERFADFGIIRKRRRATSNIFGRVVRRQKGLLESFDLRVFNHKGLSVSNSRWRSAIGWAYLRRYVAVFDFPGGKLYLRPSSHFSEDEEPLDKSGLNLLRGDAGLVVSYCRYDGPAREAGLLKGDRILRVNGKPAKAFSLFELRRLLGREGDRVRIEAQRGKETIDVEFQLREYHRFFATRMGPNARVLAEVRLVEGCDIPIVSVECLGETRYFLLSTGTGATALDDSLRPKLGDTLQRQTGSSEDGTLAWEFFKAPPVDFGGLQIRGMSAICTDLHLFSEYAGLEVAGAIGLDSLFNHIVELDLSGRAIRIYDRVPESMERDSVVLPLHEGSMTVRVNLPVIGPQEFLLDSRNFNSLELHADLFERLTKSGKIDQRFQYGSSAHRKRRGEIGRLRRFALGDFMHQGVSIVKSEKYSAIGCGYLRRYVVVFDFPGQRLYLKPSKHFSEPEEPYDQSGLIFSRSDGQTVVDALWKHSPAKEAGLTKKDRILSVNEKPVEEFSMPELRKLLSREGEFVRMTIQRCGETLDFKFRLREFHTFLPKPIEPAVAEKQSARQAAPN